MYILCISRKSISSGSQRLAAMGQPKVYNDSLRGRASALKVVPRYTNAEGEEKYLERKDLTQLVEYAERYEASVARFRYQDWSARYAPSRQAHAFWSDAAPESWEGPAALPGYAQVGLYSALRAGYHVTLWTYNMSVTGLPASERLKVGRMYVRTYVIFYSRSRDLHSRSPQIDSRSGELDWRSRNLDVWI